MNWSLPVCVTVGGVKREIASDYRDILRVISRLSDGEEDDQVRVYVAMALFYPRFEEIPESCLQEAAEKMVWFIACGEQDDGERRPRLIDWEQDYAMIVADINKIAGRDVRGAEPLHWWSFVSLFSSIGEGQLSTVVAIREKLRTGKRLEPWEREFYRKNRSRVDLKTRYTSAEQDALSAWTGQKGGEASWQTEE